MLTFKTSTFRVLYNLVQGIAAGGIVGWIAWYFFGTEIGIAAGIVFFLSFIWLVVIGSRIEIAVNGDQLVVKQGRKVRSFDLRRCTIVAKTRHSNGDTDCNLEITDDSGKTEDIDCQLLGYHQFERLLDAIGVTGENAPVTKLETKRSNQ